MNFEEELDRIAALYRRQGYEVVIRPGPTQLPAFAHDFKVELLAHRADQGVLVAIKKNRQAIAADGNIQRYAETTGLQPGWRFDFVILEPENTLARELVGAKEFSDEDILGSLEQATRLVRDGLDQYAVVAAWAAFEAAMRTHLRLSGQEAGWGTPPREMLRELYSAGAFAPEEFARIDLAFRLRNQIVHGFSPLPSGIQMSNGAIVELLSDLTRRLLGSSQCVVQPA
jgi:hypothetical protein